MRFGANLLRGARPIALDGGGAPRPGSGGGGSSLGALWSQHQKPLLIGGAGIAVVLGLRHRRTAATAAGSADLPGMGDPAGANGATVAGYTPADTSGTDVYNALQPQVEQTQSMLQQLLGALAAAPAAAASAVTGTTPARPRRRPKPKPKAKPRGKAKGKGKSKAPAKHHPATGRPRSRFSTLAPAGRAAPRRAASPAPHKAERDKAHVVRKGETAASIAAKHGTNAVAIHRANSRLVPARVAPGKRIVVPNKKARR